MIEYVMPGHEDDDEISIILNSTPDQKIVTLTIEAEKPIDTHDLILCLESYLCDLIRATSQAPSNETDLH